MSQDATTAPQLSRLLGLTSAAVRRHLEALEDDGLIVAKDSGRRPPAGRGRPAKVFRITDAGRDRFYQAYAELAAQAIAQLVEEVGPDCLQALAKVHFEPVELAFTAIRAAMPDKPAFDALAAAFNQHGYAAEVSPLGGGAQLCQHHCPVTDVARAYPELCEAETRLIATLLGSHVQRLATIAHGDGVCTTSIPGRTK